METTLDEAAIDEFLAVYRESFTALDDVAAARQSLDDEEFRAEMREESVLKFVAWDDDRRPVAMAFVATDLSVVPWISPSYYAERFPEHHARGVIYYFGALLVRAQHRGGLVSYELLKELSRFVAMNKGIAAFDCCQFNRDTVALPELVARVASEVCLVDTQQIDAQWYYAYVTSDLREGFSHDPLPSIRAIADVAPTDDVFIDLVALEEAEKEAEPASDRSDATGPNSSLQSTNGGSKK
jgi:hypothetical protein